MTENHWKAPADAAFVIVDVQNDFCPGGNLAVPNGDEVVPVINKIRRSFDNVVLTQDFHPAGHSSFASSHGKQPQIPPELIDMPYGKQALWPDHCVQGTAGADFRSDLEIDGNEYLIQKGTHKNIDSYSAFYENDRTTCPAFDDGDTFTDKMQDAGIKTLVFAGLAFDYCVGWNALDAAAEGFDVIVVEDACRGIAPESMAAMREQLEKAGVRIVKSDDLEQALGKPKPVPGPTPDMGGPKL